MLNAEARINQSWRTTLADAVQDGLHTESWLVKTIITEHSSGEDYDTIADEAWSLSTKLRRARHHEEANDLETTLWIAILSDRYGPYIRRNDEFRRLAERIARRPESYESLHSYARPAALAATDHIEEVNERLAYIARPPADNAPIKTHITHLHAAMHAAKLCEKALQHCHRYEPPRPNNFDRPIAAARRTIQALTTKRGDVVEFRATECLHATREQIEQATNARKQEIQTTLKEPASTSFYEEQRTLTDLGTHARAEQIPARINDIKIELALRSRPDLGHQPGHCRAKRAAARKRRQKRTLIQTPP